MQLREFHFTEGTSSKFWKITVDRVKQTVHYGRIGATGQTQTKEFDSDAAANAASEKLIAEKVRKGYAEVGSGIVEADSTNLKLPDPREQMPNRLEPIQRTASTQPRTASPVEDDLLNVARSLDLSEEDYVRAGVRPRTPKPKPTAPRFDFHEAVERFRKLPKDWWGFKFAQAYICPVITPEEAHFWLAVMVRSSEKADHEAVISELESLKFTGDLTDDDLYPVQGKSGTIRFWARREIAIIIAAVRPLTELLSLNTRLSPQHHFNLLQQVFEGFQDFVFPYLSAAEFSALQEECRRLLSGDGPHSNIMHAFAAKLGLSDFAIREVETWPTSRLNYINDYLYNYQFDILLGMRNRELIIEHAVRTETFPVNQEQVRLWLAAAEYDAIDVVSGVILRLTDKKWAETMAKALLRVHAQEAVLPMLCIYHESKAPGVAREWFDMNPKHAAAGLVPIAVSENPLARKAAVMLSELARRGHRQVVEAHIDAMPLEGAERLRAVVFEHDTEPQYDFLDSATTPDSMLNAMPSPINPRSGDPCLTDLPPVVVQSTLGLRRINEQQFVGLLGELRKSSLESPMPLVAAVKLTADSHSLDSFAWALFENWLADGASPKEKWRMISLGLFGGDAVALKLASLVRKWPGESQHARAVLGLDCLRAIGTDTALMQINGIANKVPFKGIKERAAECMEQIAQARGMTRSRLEDRIIPDCDLDERGSRVFDFGPRQFRFVLSPDMKAMVKDAAGKVAADLPKPNAKDDKQLAETAVAEWKLLKKQVAEVAKVQAARLEQAMVTGRRWTPSEFSQLMVHHPLMTNLVRLFVWGAYEETGALVSTFRVTEDQSFADMADSEYVVSGNLIVGIVHPLQLSRADRAAWGEIWSDYEIVPPFPQLGRAIMKLAPEENELLSLTRFSQVKIIPQTLVFTLDKLGWTRGTPADGGCFNEHTKPFPGANATAIVQYDPGVIVGYIAELGDQVISGCFWVPGIYYSNGEMWPDHKGRLKWGDVDPVAVSEVLADITSIVSKGN